MLEANWHWTNPNDEVFQLAAERGEFPYISYTNGITAD